MIYVYVRGLPSGSMVKNLPAMQELQEMQVQSLCLEDPLESMATYSDVLTWRIPWIEEAGRPPYGCKEPGRTKVT